MVSWLSNVVSFRRVILRRDSVLAAVQGLHKNLPESAAWLEVSFSSSRNVDNFVRPRIARPGFNLGRLCSQHGGIN